MLKKSAILRSILISILSVVPSIVSVLSLGLFATLGNDLPASKLFTALTLFGLLRVPLIFYPSILNTITDGKLSIDRIDQYLLSDNLRPYIVAETDPAISVRFANATFKWPSHVVFKTDVKNSEKNSHLSVPDIVIKKGELVVVFGVIGSGKTMFLQSILGELCKDSGLLSRSGSIAYASQMPWLPQDNIRNIILFGKELAYSRYREVLKSCQLEKDLDSLDYGDRTKIGMKQSETNSIILTYFR